MFETDGHPIKSNSQIRWNTQVGLFTLGRTNLIKIRGVSVPVPEHSFRTEREGNTPNKKVALFQNIQQIVAFQSADRTRKKKK